MQYLYDARLAETLFTGEAWWVWSGEGVWDRTRDDRPIWCRWFAREVDLAAGQSIVLALSADTRYLLYVNGALLTRGPQKSDFGRQYYDVLRLDAEVSPGRNLLLIRVDCNLPSFAEYDHTGPAGSELTAAPGLIVDGWVVGADNTPGERLATPGGWRARVDPALDFPIDPEQPAFVGYKEHLDFRLLSPDFYARPDLDDPAWHEVAPIRPGMKPGTNRHAVIPHRLVPRDLLPLVREPVPFVAITEIAGTDASVRLAGGRVRIVVPGHEGLRLLLDAGVLRTAHPVVEFTAGRNAKIRLKYAERLLRNGERWFGEWDDQCTITGYSDWLVADGTPRRWEPLHWRTFRYLELSVETATEPLEITDLTALDCHYPIDPLVPFACSDPEFERAWDVGVRTQQACAGDTYYDCPYYEQLQYSGDTQVQALYTYAISGRTDLPRQAIRAFHRSRLPEGLTQSRWPCRVPQVIPYWSLHYLLMLYDWYLYTGNVSAIRHEVLGAVMDLRWFLDRRVPPGVIGPLEHWGVADWSPEWCALSETGETPGFHEGPTALPNLMTIAALERVAVLLELLEEDYLVTPLRDAAAQLRAACPMFHDDATGYWHDIPGQPVVSQLTNAWAILVDAVPAAERSVLVERVATEPGLCQTGYLGDYFLFDAFLKAGRPDLVVRRFDSYRQLLRGGATTWPEKPGNARSECHAWSNAMSYHLIRTILGFAVAEPGCRRLAVRPYVEGLDRVAGGFVTPHGPVTVAYEAAAASPWTVEVPEGVIVDLTVSGRERRLAAGSHRC